ncbi:MAG: transcriptional regulator PhoU [Methanomassiliicoccales archaeon PtaB.Bin215]|nr:MAG: transcriptional regulator PhoU [Methanomassiliicoccales archaeon PtaB.Bin215]
MFVKRDNNMNTEVRRVQKTGASTLTVSLPKDWVDSSGLKAGDQVSMAVQLDGTILLDTNMDRRKETLRKEIWTDADESAEHLTRKLIGAYLVGYNVIEVRSKDRMEPEAKSAIREFSRLAIGPEVVEETANSVIMHDLSDPVELPQEKCVRRMHLIVRTMHADAVEALCEEDKGLAEDVIDRDTDVDRLYWMAVKQNNLIARDRKLGDRMGLDIFESNDLMLVARGIERIGDHAVRISRNALISAEDPDKLPAAAEIRKLSAESMKVLEKGMDALFRKDIPEANEVIDQGREVVKRCEKLGQVTRAKDSREAIIINMVMDSIIRSTMYAVDIAEIAINGAMRQ